jgi:hypothetical protein
VTLGQLVRKVRLVVLLVLLVLLVQQALLDLQEPQEPLEPQGQLVLKDYKAIREFKEQQVLQAQQAQ